jgi:ubiquitin conjugation factor E4 B
LSGPARPTSEKASGEAAGSPSGSTPNPANSQKAESAPKKITVNPAPAANPFSKLAARPASSSGSSPTPSVSSPPANMKRQFAEDEQTISKTPHKKSSAAAAEETIEVWENKTLGQIFRISLEPSPHKVIPLPNLKSELEEEKLPVSLSIDKLDSAILEACSTIPHNRPVLDYLLPCWKRVVKALRGLKGYVGSKDAILKEAKRLCMSHCLFALEMPELYGSVDLWK